MTLRIPDDEVARPPSIEADSPIGEAARRPVDSIAVGAEDSAALTPTRIIAINPEPMPGPLVGNIDVRTSPTIDDGFDDEPTPLVRRIQRTPPPSPHPVVPAVPAVPTASGLPPSAPPETPSSVAPPAP
ncbi:MAG: hypothetical protein WBY94_11665, partial [Polyangiaceae bacterium]